MELEQGKGHGKNLVGGGWGRKLTKHGTTRAVCLDFKFCFTFKRTVPYCSAVFIRESRLELGQFTTSMSAGPRSVICAMSCVHCFTC